MTTKYLPQSIIFRDNCLEGEAARLRSPAPGPACSMWCPQRTSQVRPSTGTRGWDSKCGVGGSEQNYHIKNHRHYWQKIEKNLKLELSLQNIGLTKDLWNIEVNQSEKPNKQEWLTVIGSCLLECDQISSHWETHERLLRQETDLDSFRDL